MRKTWIAALAAVVLAGVAGAVPSSSTSAAGTQGYLVVLAGTQGADGFAATGTQAAIAAAVTAAGGTVANEKLSCMPRWRSDAQVKPEASQLAMMRACTSSR